MFLIGVSLRHELTQEDAKNKEEQRAKALQERRERLEASKLAMSMKNENNIQLDTKQNDSIKDLEIKGIKSREEVEKEREIEKEQEKERSQKKSGPGIIEKILGMATGTSLMLNALTSISEKLEDAGINSREDVKEALKRADRDASDEEIEKVIDLLEENVKEFKERMELEEFLAIREIEFKREEEERELKQNEELKQREDTFLEESIKSIEF